MLGEFIQRFRSMGIRRIVNAVFQNLASGLKEGVKNVYEYSKAIGSSFAPAMDSAASSLLQMKNSLGAAFAPLIQSLIPVLQTVVNWFINIINYANQFFALMRGQATWTRAVPATTTAFGKQEKAAKGAAAAVKDLLADWDELNIIQGDKSGAGSGAGTKTAEDYLNMFEEVSTYDNKVKDIVGFLKDNFDTILTVAEAIAAGYIVIVLEGTINLFIIVKIMLVLRQEPTQVVKVGLDGFTRAEGIVFFHDSKNFTVLSRNSQVTP